jgi:hypothetical protein
MEHPGEHPRLAGVELTAGLRLIDDRLHVLRGVLLLEGLGVDPEQPHYRVRDPRQAEGQRGGDLPEPAHRPGEQESRSLGLVYGHHLRDLLADADVKCGGERERDRERQPDRDAVREGPAEQGLDQVGERGLAEKSDPDRGHGDPHLAGREVLVDPVDLVEHPPGAALALPGEGLDPGSPRPDEGKLGRYEQAVHRNQKEQDE